MKNPKSQIRNLCEPERSRPSGEDSRHRGGSFLSVAQALAGLMHPRLAAALCLVLGSLVVSAQPVTNHLALPMPDLAKPPAGSSIMDPVFGSRLLRITDAAAAGFPGAFPQYAKRQAWNVDESLLLTVGDSTFDLYDGSTYQFKRMVGSVFGDDVFWHPTATNLVFYNSQNCLYSHDVLTD